MDVWRLPDLPGSLASTLYGEIVACTAAAGPGAPPWWAWLSARQLWSSPLRRQHFQQSSEAWPLSVPTFQGSPLRFWFRVRGPGSIHSHGDWHAWKYSSMWTGSTGCHDQLHPALKILKGLRRPLALSSVDSLVTGPCSGVKTTLWEAY